MLTLVIVVAPYAFVDDYPADIKERAAPPSPRQRRAGALGGAAFLVVLLGSQLAVVLSWSVAHPGADLLELIVMAAISIGLFVLVDIVVVDWLVICTWRPRVIVLPGTEDCAGWRDYRHHVRDQFRPRGVLVLLVGSLLVGFLAWLA